MTMVKKINKIQPCDDLRIVYYASSIRPFREHLLGFIKICNSNAHYRPVIITGEKQYLAVCTLVEQQATSIVVVMLDTDILRQVKVLKSAHIIVGSAKGVCKQISRIISLFKRQQVTIKLRPGKVTKASGFLATSKTRLSYVIKEYFSHKLFSSYTLVTDDFDRYYCITAYGSCHEALIIHPSPKLIYLNRAVKSDVEKNKILFAPTHRGYGEISSIDDFVTSTTTKKKLTDLGWTTVYSCHEHGSMSAKLQNAQIEIFSGNWEEIGLVVTDFSSIGADVQIATGMCTIYYIKDSDIDLNKYPLPEFFHHEIQSSLSVSTESGLLTAISKNSDLSRNQTSFMDSPEYQCECYFEKIIQKVQLSQ